MCYSYWNMYQLLDVSTLLYLSAPTQRFMINRGYGTNFISATDSVSWRLCLAIQGIPALLLCALCFYLPYTPRWLIGRKRIEEARASLSWIRNRPPTDELITLELLEIQAEAMFGARLFLCRSEPQKPDRSYTHRGGSQH